MKKYIITLLIITTLLFSVFADTTNGERIIDVGSPVWSAVKSLYISQGHALPSTTGPWSESEIKLMLSRLDENKLSSSEKETLSWIYKEMDHEEDVFKFGLDANLEVYAHTNPDYFVGRDNWGREANSTKPMLVFTTDSWIGKNFYGYFSFSAANAKIMAGSDKKEMFASTNISTNLIMVPPASMKTLDFGFPYKAFLSAGGDNWNLMWGRFNLGWGPGTTGNFVIGDHLGYHNAARVTAFNNSFKYTFLVDSFTHPMNYYNYDPADPSKSGYFGGIESGVSTQEVLQGIRLMLAHRLEWRAFSDKLNIVLTEGLMYMSEDNMIDLNVLNPSMLWHNLYTRAHSNSILSLEVDWTVFKGFNVYGELVLDENILPGENVPGKAGESPAEPSAMGYMLGATYTLPLSKGILSFNAEGAYTDPFLYLRDGGMASSGEKRDQKKGQYGINYVVALRDIYNTGGNVQYTEEFLGYRYGGDAIVGNLSADYTEYGKWNVGTNLFFMAHGTFDQWTVWTRINPSKDHPEYPEENPVTPTTSHVSENHRDPNASDRDSVEYTFDLTLKGGYMILDNLEAYASCDFIYVVNPGNLSSVTPKSDMQLTIGLSYAL